MPQLRQLSLKKRGKYLKNGKFSLNLSNIKVYFFRIESIHSKAFLKKAISILSNYLHHFGHALDK